MRPIDAIEQEAYEEFSLDFEVMYENEIKPLLASEMQDNVPVLLRRLNKYAGLLPRLSVFQAKAHRFLKQAELQALRSCPPEYEKKYMFDRYVDAEVMDIAYIYELSGGLISTIDKSACEIQSQIKAETAMPNRRNLDEA